MLDRHRGPLHRTRPPHGNHLGEGSKLAVIPLPPRVGRAVDQATGGRTSGGPLLLTRAGNRMHRHAATRIVVGSRPATLTLGPRPATTEPATTPTATPATSSPPSSPAAVSPTNTAR